MTQLVGGPDRTETATEPSREPERPIKRMVKSQSFGGRPVTAVVLPLIQTASQNMQASDISSFEKALNKRLVIASAGNAVNRISLANVREWTASYLRDHAEETKRFPEIENEPHWTLFAYDAPSEAAVFVIVAFASDQFKVLAGRGNSVDVRDFGENFIGDVSATIEDAKRRFPEASDVLEIPVHQAYYWIERN